MNKKGFAEIGKYHHLKMNISHLIWGLQVKCSAFAKGPEKIDLRAAESRYIGQIIRELWRTRE